MRVTDPDLMSYVVRIVIPMRREFGRSVDVHQFLHDLPYAKEIIEQALNSKDTRLIGYAEYIQTKLWGARGISASPSTALKNAVVVDSIISADTSAETSLRPSTLIVDTNKDAAMEKYKTRLR